MNKHYASLLAVSKGSKIEQFNALLIENFHAHLILLSLSECCCNDGKMQKRILGPSARM